MWRVGALALGAWVGAMGSIVHRQAWFAAGVVWPWGLVVVLVTTAVLVHATGRWRRLGGAWFALGWALVLTGQQLAPGGGYLIATDWLGWSFVLLTAGVIVLDVVRASRVGP